MSKRQVIVVAAIFNVLMIVAFIFSNIYIWGYLNGYLTRNEWSPLQIGIAHMTVIQGDAVPIGTFIPFPNYPFILFWASTVGNLVLIALVLRKPDI